MESAEQDGQNEERQGAQPEGIDAEAAGNPWRDGKDGKGADAQETKAESQCDEGNDACDLAR